MKINQKLIDKIAKLSQLNLNKEEKIKMEKDLNKILDLIWHIEITLESFII